MFYNQFLFLIQHMQVVTRSTSPNMKTVRHARRQGRFLEIKGNLKKKKIHITNPGSDFLGGSLSSRDNVRVPTKIRKARQSRQLKRWVQMSVQHYWDAIQNSHPEPPKLSVTKKWQNKTKNSTCKLHRTRILEEYQCKRCPKPYIVYIKCYSSSSTRFIRKPSNSRRLAIKTERKNFQVINKSIIYMFFKNLLTTERN